MTTESIAHRPWLGFGLAFCTALLWGVLPIFIKLALVVADSATITSYRFLVAAAFVGLMLMFTRSRPAKSPLGNKRWALVIVTSVLLVLNYVANVEALLFINPEFVQVLMQLAPFLLMVGGVVFFKERFSRLQMLGACALLIGLVLFFNQSIARGVDITEGELIGIAITVFAAICWAVYALLQKPLLRHLNAGQLTFWIYILGGVMLLPFASMSVITQMNALQLGALLFCCANTLLAYGAFTYALGIWQASKVGAVIALAPLFTLLSTEWAVNTWPNVFVSSELNLLAFVGAGFVIAGSMLASLGR